MWLIVLVFTCMLYCSCHYINNKVDLKDDNIIEEVVEVVIEKETGLDIDLTPESVEK